MYTVAKKGLHYLIKSFTGNTTFELVFTHRNKDRTPVEGITRESIYEVLIDHIKCANEKKWSRENEIQIRHLEAALQSQRVIISRKINETKESM